MIRDKSSKNGGPVEDTVTPDVLLRSSRCHSDISDLPIGGLMYYRKDSSMPEEIQIRLNPLQFSALWKLK